MSAVLVQKVELIEQLKRATLDGLSWKRFPGGYGTEWKGKSVGIDELPDEPLALNVKDRLHVVDGVLTSTLLVRATVRESVEIAQSLRELVAVVYEQFRPEDQAASERFRAKQQVEAREAARAEQQALKDLLQDG